MTSLRVLVARFSLVGVLNTFAGLSIIYALKAFAGFGDIAANAAGYGAGFVLSFVLNRNWTFRSRGGWVRQLFGFGAIVAVAYLLNLAVALMLIRSGTVNAYVAHAIAIVPYTATVFLGSRWLFSSGMLSPARPAAG